MDNLHESAAVAEAVKPLAFPFTRSNYRHELVARTGRVCLVERTSTHPDSFGSAHHEVVVLRHLAARVGPRGQRLPACEAYPCSRVWGRAGWTYTSRGAAERRYDALCLETPSIQQPRSVAGWMDSLAVVGMSVVPQGVLDPGVEGW